MTFYKVTSVVVLLVTLLTKVKGHGVPSTRTTGGTTAPINKWPWMVSLHNSSHLCGGSLINDLWVLTSADCVSSFNITQDILTVYLGRERQQGPNPNEVKRTVEEIIIHQDYDSVTGNSNIALLMLSAPVNFTSYIAPVVLADSNSTFYTGINATVTCWGNTEISGSLSENLVEFEVAVVGSQQCKCSCGESNITHNMMCAGFLEGGEGFCNGNGGDPLVSDLHGVWVQAGIASFGEGCAASNFTAVYTRVSQYQSWISNHTVSHHPSFITFTSNGTDDDLSVSCVAPTNTSPNAEPVFCGQAPLNAGIWEGSEATDGLWPWMVSLQKNGQLVCGGTLVSLDSVLSDATCFTSFPNASEWTVVFGRLKQNGSSPNEASFQVSNISLSNLTGSNIALLKLSSRPTLSDYIQPICLDDGRTSFEGSKCWVAEWRSGQGAEAVLQEFSAAVQKCGDASPRDIICTEQFTEDQSGSGGPLMCVLDRSWFQVAVLRSPLSASSERRKRAANHIFDKLSRFNEFLSDKLGPFLTPHSTNTTAASTVTPSASSTLGNTATSPHATTGMIGSGGTRSHSPFFLLIHLLALVVFL
ncbi:polyserase-2 [Nothobranchius furzeri]|uniref:Polyserase-2-like n=1 Tax=Nothobranchius furzeri TaxID=105023 RepID=A0A9D2YV41_NOTFU|nr:polyserase-2-like [Nothobranchius furzeri]